MKVRLPSLDQLLDFNAELEQRLSFEIPEKSPFQAYVSQHFSRFLAGNGSITSLRDVSRKRLLLQGQKLITTDVAANKLSLNIQRYSQAKVQLKKDGYSMPNLVKLHKRVFKGKQAGRIRQSACYIETRRIEFVEAKKIPNSIAVWSQLIHHPELSDLAKVVFGHSYFIGIHPFSDGNGRISRLFVDTFLDEKLNLAVNPLLFNLFH